LHRRIIARYRTGLGLLQRDISVTSPTNPRQEAPVGQPTQNVLLACCRWTKTRHAMGGHHICALAGPY
jgi:hypothetical protein